MLSILINFLKNFFNRSQASFMDVLSDMMDVKKIPSQCRLSRNGHEFLTPST